MDPLVSVIVPIYKAEEYLPGCLDSIVAQTYRNLEIILVDDGSPDSSGAICDRYAEADSRIRVIHQKNQGVATTRNTGLDAVTGDYIMFVDSDDWIPPDAVQTLYDCMIRDGSDMAVGHAVKIYDDMHTADVYHGRKRNAVLSGEEALSTLGTDQEIPYCLWGKLYNRVVWDNIRFVNLRQAEDIVALPYLLRSCEKISITDKLVYYYYQRTTSIVHTVNDDVIRDSIVGAWYVAKILIEWCMWENAGVYYRSGMRRAITMKDVASVRKLRREIFTNAERYRLIRQYWKNYFELAIIYFPNMYKMLRGAKHLRRRK